MLPCQNGIGGKQLFKIIFGQLYVISVRAIVIKINISVKNTVVAYSTLDRAIESSLILTERSALQDLYQRVGNVISIPRLEGYLIGYVPGKTNIIGYGGGQIKYGRSRIRIIGKQHPNDAIRVKSRQSIHRVDDIGIKRTSRKNTERLLCSTLTVNNFYIIIMLPCQSDRGAQGSAQIKRLFRDDSVFNEIPLNVIVGNILTQIITHEPIHIRLEGFAVIILCVRQIFTGTQSDRNSVKKIAVRIMEEHLEGFLLCLSLFHVSNYDYVTLGHLVIHIVGGNVLPALEYVSFFNIIRNNLIEIDAYRQKRGMEIMQLIRLIIIEVDLVHIRHAERQVDSQRQLHFLAVLCLVGHKIIQHEL